MFIKSAVDVDVFLSTRDTESYSTLIITFPLTQHTRLVQGQGLMCDEEE